MIYDYKGLFSTPYPNKKFTADEIDDINRAYMTLMMIKDIMLKEENRYKELQILVGHCDPKDLYEYEIELKNNIESHHSRAFAFRKFEHDMSILEGLKEYAKQHSYQKQPDLEFSEKIKRGEV